MSLKGSRAIEAGVFTDGPLFRFRAFDVNFFSGVELCKLALPHLRASCGRIVFTSTGVAEMPMAAWSPYCRYAS
jgi:short-subunit dehydrogenase involved in D-alanine esterification of teichoic acids